MSDRTKSVGGSDAPVLMKGDHFGKTPAILWEEKTGRRKPEDLSRKLNVQMGTFTEPFNAQWYTQETKFSVLLEPAQLCHPDHPFITAHLDGYTMGPDGNKGVWEAKHTSAFSKADPVEAYYAQVQHYMMVTDLQWAHLSVFKGTSGWAYHHVDRDEVYIKQLLYRERIFWKAVVDDQLPEEWAPVVTPVKVDALRTVDMTGSNEWGSLSQDWLNHRESSKKFEIASGCLKKLVEPDVKNAHGHGIFITRAKNGALTIRGED